jgi:NADP-dependent 3-hydroxy acid dehydrogenase YdfG
MDILINNAGIGGKMTLLHEIPSQEIDDLIDTNLKAPFYLMHAALPVMINALDKHPDSLKTIININSVAGKTAYPYWSLYDASKFGLRAITEAVAEEQRENGIRVCGIYPGAVDTPIWDKIDMGQTPDTHHMLNPQDIVDAVLFMLLQPTYAFCSELVIKPTRSVL